MLEAAELHTDINRQESHPGTKEHRPQQGLLFHDLLSTEEEYDSHAFNNRTKSSHQEISSLSAQVPDGICEKAVNCS